MERRDATTGVSRPWINVFGRCLSVVHRQGATRSATPIIPDVADSNSVQILRPSMIACMRCMPAIDRCAMSRRRPITTGLENVLALDKLMARPWAGMCFYKLWTRSKSIGDVSLLPVHPYLHSRVPYPSRLEPVRQCTWASGLPLSRPGRPTDQPADIRSVVHSACFLFDALI